MKSYIPTVFNIIIILFTQQCEQFFVYCWVERTLVGSFLSRFWLKILFLFNNCVYFSLLFIISQYLYILSQFGILLNIYIYWYIVYLLVQIINIIYEHVFKIFWWFWMMIFSSASFLEVLFHMPFIYLQHIILLIVSEL